jgi:hypothetical protein
MTTALLCVDIQKSYSSEDLVIPIIQFVDAIKPDFLLPLRIVGVGQKYRMFTQLKFIQI